MKQEKPPFLMRFRERLMLLDETAEVVAGATFDPESNLWLDSKGVPLWRARSKRPPTTCYTNGRRIPAGYTQSGKWKPSKWRPGKTDKRAGR
jgi:hypothetical protein